MCEENVELKEDLSLGLMSWIEFKVSSSILLIANAKKYTEFFENIQCKVCCASCEQIGTDSFQKEYDTSFDYVIGIEILETETMPEKLLQRIKLLLKPNGKFFLGTDNRIGLRYLCGEQDPFTHRCFDGPDNYVSYFSTREQNEFIGKCYTKDELKRYLVQIGYQFRFYSVLSTLENPQLIIAEDYQPIERISTRYTPLYRNPDTVLFREEQLCDDFVQNNALHAVANAFFVECTLDGNFIDAKQVTLSLDRGKENAYATIIHSETVEKKAIFDEGKCSLRKLAQNMSDLQNRGILTVKGKRIRESYVMPYVGEMLGDVYLRGLLKTNANEFVKYMDYFRQLIIKSSDIVCENEYGFILKNGYVDMVPLNCFYKDEEFVFFDQEFCIHNYPLNAILYRAIVVVYEQVPEKEVLVPVEFIWERYGLKSKLAYWNQITTEFVNHIKRRNQLVTFYEEHLRNEWITNYNRRRLNEMVDNMEFYEEYRRDSCFEGLHDKKVFLFGAGKWCDKFLAFYKNECNICRILDNDESKWGTTMQGIPIASPDSLVGEQDAYKVIICAKNYKPIFRQLKRMQVIYIGIYDANYCYPGRQMLNIIPSGEMNKKYRIGYLSGTFDLFHIGHVNILRKAKEQCEYLIVAVTSDEYVRTHKNKEPIIPFDERVEMLKACKYADEVVGVPVNYAGTIDAFQKYHFDCQFCGSDYENDEWWLEQKRFLQAHGSDLVFFPYTEQTSSTQIRALIDKELL